MRGFMYVWSLLAVLLLRAEEGNGADASEETPTWDNNLKALQLHDILVFRQVAFIMAVVERHYDTGNFTIQQSEQDLLEKRAMLLEKRLKRSTTYQPYTDNPYDLGPLNQCSSPKVSQCSFSPDVTIPEYQARRIRYTFDILDPIMNDRFTQGLIVTGGEAQCYHDIVNSMTCLTVATPRCIGNDMVRYESFTSSECEEALTRVTSCKGRTFLTSSLCSVHVVASIRAYSTLPTGTYSLTRCITPSIDVCDSAGTTPEWIAVQYVNTFNDVSSVGTNMVINQLRSDACKTDYMRASCTMPTCTSEGNLQGTLTFDQCNRASNCVLDILTGATRSTVEKVPTLLCQSYKTVRAPSGSSAKAGTTIIADTILSSVLLAVGLVFL